jgi:predicted DNA-binding protein
MMKTFSIRLHKIEEERINELARLNYMSKSSYIRMLILIDIEKKIEAHLKEKKHVRKPRIAK